MNSLKDVLKGIHIEEEEKAPDRVKMITERPKDEIKLEKLYDEKFVPKKSQLDPTDDLVEIENGIESQSIFEDLVKSEGYLVWCADTHQTWYAYDKLCLDSNFIYRLDLEIVEVNDNATAYYWYKERGGSYQNGIIERKTCYILDMPGNETYEVYFDSNMPMLKYGKATPNGSFVHKYPNRFHRDMAILTLDKLYSESSKKAASKKIRQELKDNEAVIISDGAWMREVCSNAFWYLDNESAVKFTEGHLPTEVDQAVLISEIKGATNALRYCMMMEKKKIHYYYDNTSIVNIFRNRKQEYIEEVKTYKDLLEKMDKEGYSVEFIELHPKTDKEHAEDNLALMYFHNSCDSECRIMCDIFKKNYRDNAIQDGNTGKTYKQVKQEFAKKPTNNSKNGKNKYGRRF